VIKFVTVNKMRRGQLIIWAPNDQNKLGNATCNTLPPCLIKNRDDPRAGYHPILYETKHNACDM
jgi:hypothetical protein